MFENLITDRTQNDVDTDTKKGYYDINDRNRVETAVEEAAQYLTNNGYPTNVNVKKDWNYNYFPTESEMSRYFANVKKIKSQTGIPDRLFNIVDTVSKLGWKEANDIEKLLKFSVEIMDKINSQQLYAGTFFAGEEW